MPTGTIRTPRLRLVPLRDTDLEDLHRLHSEPEVMRGSTGIATPRTRAETVEWLVSALAVTGAGCGHCRVDRPEGGRPQAECSWAPPR